MDTVLFVPGRPEPVCTFEPLFNAIMERGHQVVGIEIDWGANDGPYWLEQIKEVCDQHDPANTILTGFSVGGFLSLLTATVWSPRRLVALSPSPRFRQALTAEIRSRQSPELLRFYETISFPEVVQRITAPTALVAEQRGNRSLMHWTKCLHAALPGSSLRLLRGLHSRRLGDTHNAGHPNYIRGALRALSS